MIVTILYFLPHAILWGAHKRKPQLLDIPTETSIYFRTFIITENRLLRQEKSPVFLLFLLFYFTLVISYNKFMVNYIAP